MILEGIVEVVFPFIGRVLGYIIIDFLGQIVFYSSGYLTLKLFTLGKYPETFVPAGGDSYQEKYCIITGITAFILVFVSGFIYLQHSTYNKPLKFVTATRKAWPSLGFASLAI